MTMNLTVEKSQSASVAHGRGTDSYRSPARYDIKLDKVVVGKLGCAKMTYMAVADWSVDVINADGSFRRVRTMLRSKKAAIAWIHANAATFIN